MAFVKGKSGNPRGRPKSDYKISELAKEHTNVALVTLVYVASDIKAPAAARVSASVALLDRGYGRPMQSIEHSGEIDHIMHNSDQDKAILDRYWQQKQTEHTVQ